MMIRSRYAVALLLAVPLLAAQSPAAELVGKVVSIADGDTLTVLDFDNVQHKIRLHGIDAPERGQAFSKRSKEALGALVQDKQVTVNVVDRDRYGRDVGTVTVEGVNVNLKLVENGWAWHFVRYAPNDKALADAETAARAAHRGLWFDKAPVPPWEWRNAKRKVK
ncbi:MAG: thermonuclease family protein [Planctomycetes bacterium]|nr:thermonuclease family protein [Planctomycetota bacterium]